MFENQLREIQIKTHNTNQRKWVERTRKLKREGHRGVRARSARKFKFPFPISGSKQIATTLVTLLTVDIQMVPGTVLMLVGQPVEEHHLTLVPTLVALLDVGEVEGGQAVVRALVHAGHPALVRVVVVRGVVVVPDVHRHIESLGQWGQIQLFCLFFPYSL